MTGTFDEIAIALRVAANDAVFVAQRDEVVAHRIGLFENTANHIIAERKRHAELLGEAHRIIRALTPVEGTIRAVIGMGA